MHRSLSVINLTRMSNFAKVQRDLQKILGFFLSYHRGRDEKLHRISKKKLDLPSLDFLLWGVKGVIFGVSEK